MKKIIVTGLATLSMQTLLTAPHALAQDSSSIPSEPPATTPNTAITTATTTNIAPQRSPHRHQSPSLLRLF